MSQFVSDGMAQGHEHMGIEHSHSLPIVLRYHTLKLTETGKQAIQLMI